MILETTCLEYRKARAANATDSGFPSRSDIITTPGYTPATAAQAANYALSSLSNVSRHSGSGKRGQNLLKILPYALGNDNAAFNMRVYSVERILVPDNTVVQIKWTLLVQIACTTSAQTGVATGLVLNTERYSDTNVLTYPTASVSTVVVHSNAADMAAHVVVDLLGGEDYELTFDTGGTVTSCNALVKEL